jgi:hypothetical protein
MLKFQPVIKVLRGALQVAPLIMIALTVSNFREMPKPASNEVSNAGTVVAPTSGWLTASDKNDPFALMRHAPEPVYDGPYLSIISPYVTSTR